MLGEILIENFYYSFMYIYIECENYDKLYDMT